MLSFSQALSKMAGVVSLLMKVSHIEVVIIVAAASVFFQLEPNGENLFRVGVVSLLVYLSFKMREGVEALWWVSASSASIAEKTSHSEMRSMYANEYGHEMVRQMMTYFETYDPKISDIYWFLDKIQGEMMSCRMAALRRSHSLSTHFEALALRFIQLRIQDAYQTGKPDPKIAFRAWENWNRFSAWVEGEGAANQLVERLLGQPDPLRRTETKRDLQQQVEDNDGLTYLWSFGRQM